MKLTQFRFLFLSLFAAALISNSATAESVLLVTGKEAESIFNAFNDKPREGLIELTNLYCKNSYEKVREPDNRDDDGRSLVARCSASGFPNIENANQLFFALSGAGVPIAGTAWDGFVRVTSLSCKKTSGALAFQYRCKVKL